MSAVGTSFQNMGVLFGEKLEMNLRSVGGYLGGSVSFGIGLNRRDLHDVEDVVDLH